MLLQSKPANLMALAVLVRCASPDDAALDAGAEELAQSTGSFVVSSKVNHGSVKALEEKILLECAKKFASP